MSKNRNATVVGVDSFDQGRSILDGEYAKTAAYKKTPPSVHQRVTLVPTMEEATINNWISLLYVTRGEVSDLECVRQHIKKNTIIIAKFEWLMELVKEWDIELLPQLYFEDWLSVKVC